MMTQDREHHSAHRTGATRGIDPAYGRLDVHCAAFVSHWLRIRGAEGVPHLEDWAAALPISFATRLFRAEVRADDARLLFLGSELSGSEGEHVDSRSLYANIPHRRSQGLANLHNVLSTPCGFCFESEHLSAERRRIRTQTVVLPLLTYGDDTVQNVGQVVGFSAGLHRMPTKGSIVGMTLKVVAKWWLDIGSGVPAAPPL